jgi:hypothetical protein
VWGFSVANIAPPECQPLHDFDFLATALEWGLDRATLCHKTPIPADWLEGWDEPGYLYECIGVKVGDGELPRHPGTLTLTNEDGTVLVMTAFRVRVYPVGSTVFLEKVFHPDQPFTIDMRGMETMPDENVVTAARKALPILTTFKPLKVTRGSYAKVWERQRAAWQLMRPDIERARSYTSIAESLRRMHPELCVTNADTVERIAKKGRAGAFG